MLSSDVRGPAAAEGPVFLRYLDQQDHDVVRPDAERLQPRGNSGVQRLLDFERPARVERDLDENRVPGSRHAAIRWVCNDLVTFETNEEIEAAVRRNVRVGDQRFLNGIGDLS